MLSVLLVTCMSHKDQHNEKWLFLLVLAQQTDLVALMCHNRAGFDLAKIHPAFQQTGVLVTLMEKKQMTVHILTK